jgi:hypothetical protein
MMTNKYSQNCEICKAVVKAGEGLIEKNVNQAYSIKKWLTYHLECFVKKMKTK